MSDGPREWVWTRSPFHGATFQVHHAIADVVNDMHRYEFWMKMDNLATKARVTRGTASRAVAEIVEAGLLVVLDDQRHHGHKPSLYRFLMPSDCAIVWDPYPEVREPRTPGEVRDSDTPPPSEVRDPAAKVRDPRPGGARSARTEPKRTKEEPKTSGSPDGDPTDKNHPAYGFERFWDQYPRRDGKRLHRSPASLLWRKLTYDEKASAFKGAKNYKDACEKGIQRAMDAVRFLREQEWQEWQTPATPDTPKRPERNNGYNSPDEELFNQWRETTDA